MREQHFYREGNAEVLQLVTRGQVDDRSQHRHYPTFIVDGKDVLLQRFIQDQKARHELPMQETEVVRTIDSHQRSRNLYQSKQEILLLPEELDVRRRRAEESGTQKLMMEADDEYAAQNMDTESQMRDVRRQEILTNMPGIMPKDRSSIVKDQQSTTVQSFAIHDLELARQNVLLTRLLLERESRHAGGVMTDAASYLETQSLPGQVAIATQTDRVVATQTERHVRSRSDNDESDEDTRNRKRMKKRHGESELRTRTLWMKTPIEEEEGPCFDKRLSILRKKVQEVKEGRKVPLEPEVLREISDSLDENGSTYREKERKSTKTCQQYTEESSIGYKVLREKKNDSSSSTEIDKHEKSSNEKRMESLSSPDINVDNGKYIRETTEKKSSRKESRIKKQKKVESVIKPSFRVLEKEITMLTKKLSKLADRKVQQTTGSESTSQEKSGTSKDSKKDSDQSTAKKAEDSKKYKRFETSPSISKETKEEKFKYQRPQIMSPGSSEYEDAFEKPDKSKLTSQEAAKHKQSNAKVKRQVQTERKERKKQIVQQARESEKPRGAASKENGRSKMEKTTKLISRTRKLASIGRKEHVPISEPSTSTSSDRTNGKKNSFASRDKKSTESSEILSSHTCQQKQRLDHVSEKFSDDFVTESQRKDIDQQSAFESMTRRKTDKGITSGKEDIEIIQQFSDDFTLEPQTKELAHQMQATVESEIFDSNKQSAYHDFDKEHMSTKETAVAIKSEQDISRDFGKEHLTLKEAAEDLTILRNLEDMPLTSEAVLDIASKEQPESFKVSNKKLDDSSERTISPDSLVLKTLEEHQTEKLAYYSSKSAMEKRIAYTSGKHKEAAEESFYETEKEMSEIISEKELYELQRRDAEKTASEEMNALEKHIESLKDSSKMEYTKEEKEHDENGLYSDTISLPLEIEKDSKDAKDVTLHPSERDETVEIHRTKSDQREELSLESKEHDEKEIPSTKEAIDIEQKMIQELITENEVNTLREIKKSDVERSKEYVTQEFDVEKREESTTKAYEDVSRSFADNTRNLNGTQKAFSIDDDTLLYIDESDEASKPDHDLIQSEPPESGIIKKSTDEDELEHLSDAAETEIESHETKEESHVSPKNVSEEVEQEKIKEEEERLLEQYEERTEEIPTLKERSDAEILDRESSIDQLPKDSNLQKPTVSEPDKVDSFVIISESEAVVEPRDKGEQQADVSVPIFSSFIDDTLDVSEESDSSSDISRKTTLSTRPYDTPRHRQKWQQQESIEIAGTSGVKTFKSSGDARAEIEAEEDTDSNLSLDEIEKTEDSITTEATSELIDVEITAICEMISSEGERVSDLQERNNSKDITDFESKIEIEETDIKSEIKNLLTTIQDIVPLTLSINELNDLTKEDINDKIPVTEEDVESKSATPRKKIEKISETVKRDIKSETKLSPGKSEQVEEGKTTIEDEATIEDRDIHKTKSEKSDISSTLEKYVAKPISSERFVKKKKKPERLIVPSPGERKRVLNKSEEKAAPSYSQRRSRKFTDGDPEKQTEKQRDAESQKRSPRREGEHQRKQLMPKSKLKPDKKSTIFPKTGEIDTSKTRSKYMAWYNKKREEAEKKRLEKKAADDEEQLPRWVNRSLRQTTKQREKLTVGCKTPEITPHIRRKIKPLVNVESEQLKAIVRQGRQLRRAEGLLKEDPPIEIFARTPPASTSDTQHRLQQHSEYKYERIPPPFYLHPPPVPHPSPQLSPERSLEMQPCRSQDEQFENDLHSENVAPFQSGGRLRHQQLLEKKSVFDIAYNEAAPSQLRSDSTTPPS